MKVFVDSDVVISALLSNKGASYFLLRQTNVSFYISSISKKELTVVCSRLGIGKSELDALVKEKLRLVDIAKIFKKSQAKFKAYVHDKNDAYVVCGAVECGVQLLVTYNIRDFKAQKIRADLGIIILKPGMFLQYLRALDKNP